MGLDKMQQQKQDAEDKEFKENNMYTKEARNAQPGLMERLYDEATEKTARLEKLQREKQERDDLAFQQNNMYTKEPRNASPGLANRLYEEAAEKVMRQELLEQAAEAEEAKRAEALAAKTVPKGTAAEVQST